MILAIGGLCNRLLNFAFLRDRISEKQNQAVLRVTDEHNSLIRSARAAVT